MFSIKLINFLLYLKELCRCEANTKKVKMCFDI